MSNITITAYNDTTGSLILDELSVPNRILPASGSGGIVLTNWNTIDEIRDDAQLRQYVSASQVFLDEGKGIYDQPNSLRLLTHPTSNLFPDVDDHFEDLTNPHGTSIINIESGTLGDLNSKITDGNVVASSASLTDRHVVIADGTDKIQTDLPFIDASGTLWIPVPQDVKAIIAGSGTTALAMGVHVGGTPFLGRMDIGGAMRFMPSASNPQILMGNPNTDGGNAFIDTESQTTGDRELRLNTLGGAGLPGPVVVGQGGFLPNISNNTPLGDSTRRYQRGHINHLVSDVDVLNSSSDLDDAKFIVAQDGTYTLTLPSAATGWHYVIDRSGSSGVVTLSPSGSNTINGGSSITLDGDSLYYVFAQTNTDWRSYNLTITGSGGSGDVTAAATLIENQIVAGDSPAKGIKTLARWLYNAINGGITGTASGSGYALLLKNEKADGGGHGLFVMAGEVEGDIIFKLQDIDGTYDILEIHADNGQIVAGATFAEVSSSTGGRVFGFDQRNDGDAADFNSASGTYRIGGERANAAITVYDNAGGQTFTTTPITINLDTIKEDTGTGGTGIDLFTLSGDILTINVAGTYLIIADVGIDISTGTSRSKSRSFVEIDTGGGFSEEDGTSKQMYHRTLSQGADSSTCAFIKEFSAGDQIRLRVLRTAGGSTLVTEADETRLTIVRLT